jgi:type IX secretion system PorP/SprF family membrane protein
MKALFYILPALLFIPGISLGQDYHFSQFDANPFYINPALIGERLSDYKGLQFNAAYRDQMAYYTKFPGSYRSIAAGVDEPLSPKFSLGQFFYHDKSATGSFNTFAFMLGGSQKLIDQTKDKAGNHNLSVGLQLGLLNKSIHMENFTYDAQYSASSADGFDKSLPSGEAFRRQSFMSLNVNFGIYYRVTSNNKKFSGFGGFSIYNITKPNESYLATSEYSPLPLRFNLHGGAVCRLTRQFSLMPQLLYMSQAKAAELHAGVLMFYMLEGTPYETIYGLGVRNKDAIIFHVGLRFKGTAFRISYDVITSYLKTYGNKGLEFSLVSTLKKREKKKTDPAPAEAEGTTPATTAAPANAISPP